MSPTRAGLLLVLTTSGALGGEPEPQVLRPTAWGDVVRAGIARSQLQPAEVEGGLRLWNAAHGLQGIITADGIEVRDAPGVQPPVRMRVVAWGRPGDERAVASARPTLGACPTPGEVDVSGQCVRRVEVDHGELWEGWENRPDGLEQLFELTPPPGAGPLVVRLAVEGADVAVFGADAWWVTGDGRQLRYAGLRAWDEAWTPLPAWLEPAEGGLQIVVDDAGAVGRVTIDPALTDTAVSVIGTGGHFHPQYGAAVAFGWAVASAGDVNGDGFDDVIVGGPGYSWTTYAEGRAWLFLGGRAGLATSAAWSQDPTNVAGAKYGASVTSGDFNGDGYGDVVVAATGINAQAQDEGRAYMYLGSARGLATQPAWTEDPTNEAAAMFGLGMAGGDVNGDGIADLAVTSGPTTGRGMIVHMYYGSAGGLPNRDDRTAPLAVATYHPGSKPLSIGGDIDGDGFGDVVVGASWEADTGYSGGKVLVWRGRSQGIGANAAWAATPSGTSNGYCVSSDGDVNGDDIADIVYGSSHGSIQSQGAAHLFLGVQGAFPNPIRPDWEVRPAAQAYAFFGQACDIVGDVNGDGYNDLLIGAPQYDGALHSDGKVWLYLGQRSSPSLTPAWTAAPANREGASFGASLAGAGDVNGDGFADVIIGAPSGADVTTDGAAYLYLGCPGTPEVPGNEVDEDCDGRVRCWVDEDGDGVRSVRPPDGALRRRRLP